MTASPAGWYPAPHANNEMRYWDGQRWLESSGAVATVSFPALNSALHPGSPRTPSAVGLAVASLVVGSVAFFTGWVPWLGLTLGIVAVDLGVFALVKNQSKGMAATGIGLGGAATLTGLLVTIIFLAFTPTGESQEYVPDVATADEVTASEAPEGPATPDDSQIAESEPVAAAADGTVAHPFAQPYVAGGLIGGEKYSLTGRVLDANAGDSVAGWNMFNDAAPAGFKYVVVELTMTGIDPDGVEPSLAEWDLFLATSEGNRYSSEFVVLGDGMPSMSDGPTLYPGNAFTGYTAYIVPEAAQSFLLYDNGNYIAF